MRVSCQLFPVRNDACTRPLYVYNIQLCSRYTGNILYTAIIHLYHTTRCHHFRRCLDIMLLHTHDDVRNRVGSVELDEGPIGG